MRILATADPRSNCLVFIRGGELVVRANRPLDGPWTPTRHPNRPTRSKTQRDHRHVTLSASRRFRGRQLLQRTTERRQRAVPLASTTPWRPSTNEREDSLSHSGICPGPPTSSSMKTLSLLTTLALALLAVTDAAKCNAKTSAPAVATKAPAADPVDVPASNSTVAGDGEGAAKRSPGCGKPAAIQTGTFKITVNGKQREYMVRVPQNYDSSKAYRLVFTFHWRGGSMVSASKNAGGWYGLEALAKESTIFVSPNGLNAGWANAGGEDIQLVDAIVKTIDNGLCVNQNLRFATGFSYGGAMSHSVACSRPDVFRAVSVLSGAGFSGCAGGTKPIAYQAIHGIGDGVIPIATGRQIRDVFVKNNGCQAQNAPEPAANSGTHIKTEYKGCSAGHPVVWIPFDGGHVAEPADRGKQNWAPDATWSFFSRFN